MIFLVSEPLPSRVNMFGEVEAVNAPCCFDGELCQRGDNACIRGGRFGITVFGEAYEEDDDVCERCCDGVPRYVSFKVDSGFWYGKLNVSGVWVQLFRVVP